MGKIKVWIGCADSMDDALLGDNIKTEEKTFPDEVKFMEWARRNHKRIAHINYRYTFGRELSHFDLRDSLRDPHNVPSDVQKPKTRFTR